MPARTLMVLGSMSSSGKSLIATALCRIYRRRGWTVMPFKAQNMSNNAAVCSGGEIGRAQAVQAFAAQVEPCVDMNPILLKPEADSRSQVVVHGKVWGTFPALEYYRHKKELWQAVTYSLDALRQQADLVIIEGAGSPVELNLRQGDIVNMAVAQYAGAPCILIGDVDCGGIFAQLLGTLMLFDAEERRYLRGFIVNKFRGELELFTAAIAILEERSALPVLGVVPYLRQHGVADEDAVVLEREVDAVSGQTKPEIAVIRFPHISNFDDFDPLIAEPGLCLRYVDSPDQLYPCPKAIILPGTKSTVEDLRWMNKSGLSDRIQQLALQGVSVVGICGGYQMMGSTIHDLQHVESGQDVTPGLNLLPTATSFGAEKSTFRSRARVLARDGFWQCLNGTVIEGYEIHLGHTETSRPLLQIVEQENKEVCILDGCSSADGKIFGTYLHGIFENDHLRRAWLKSLGVSPSPVSFRMRREEAYDRLANAVEAVLDMRLLDRIIEEGVL
ncbi:MAG: cobyric acid synthase [Anaerolineae bacterium]|nr:cobyric acid synthase [Anaerolineae bacterium]